jgi:hypothetical protein
MHAREEALGLKTIEIVLKSFQLKRAELCLRVFGFWQSFGCSSDPEES